MSNSNWKEINEILIKGLKEVKKWCEDKRQEPLISIFELIHFQEREPDGPLRYWPPLFSLTVSQSTLPFPRKEIDLPKEKSELRRSINKDFNGLSDSYLNEKTTAQLLLLLENLGGHLPAEGYDNKVSIYDAYKVKAIKTWLDSQNTEDAALIWGDLSGIQEFIFTIASENALRNMRARSFFINLLEQHVILKYLNALNLPPTNVLFSGGGSFAIVSHWNGQIREKIEQIKFSINSWLLEKLDGRLYLAIVFTSFPKENLKSIFLDAVKIATQKSFIEKRNKFKEIIEKGDFPFVSDKDPFPNSCTICHKDDEELENGLCSLCERLTRVGQYLPKKNFNFISIRKEKPSEKDPFVEIEDNYYLLTDIPKDATWCIYKGKESFFEALEYKIFLFYGDTYVTYIGDLPSDFIEKIKEDKDAIASLDHLAKVAHGAELIGSLKMDADNMGLILKEGLPTDFYLEHLIGFSRYISYFFKVYLNSICNDKKSFGKQTSFLDGRSDYNKRNLAVVYSGGDDSFILGAWDEVARVAIDISAAFKEYTCHNPDLGISGGVTLHDPKMPVYQIVQTTDKALKIAKDNQQECWQCHKNWLNCPLLSKVKCKRKDSLCLFYTPYLYGRWLELKERPLPKYEKKFNRLNLVAKWQFYHDGQSINEIEDYILIPLRQILSAFSRLKKGGRMVHRLLDILDVWQEEGEIYLPKLVWLMARFKTELERIKTEDKFSLYKVLDRQLHYYNPNKLSILHVPLMWTALWLRGGENE